MAVIEPATTPSAGRTAPRAVCTQTSAPTSRVSTPLTASSMGETAPGIEQADEGARGADDAGDAREASQEPVAFLVDALHATPCRVRHPEERVPSFEL